MVQSYRSGLAVAVCALFAVGYAVRLTELHSGSSVVPVDVELGSIERGVELPDRHVKLGEHIRLYGGMIYEFEATGEGKQPTPATRLHYCYYPVISTTNHALLELSELAEVHGGLSKIPEHEAPELERISVLVKTREFATVADVEGLPLWQRSGGVSGVVVNDTVRLAPPERSLLKKAFPGIDLDHLVLVDADRRPVSLAGVTFAWGLALALLSTSLWLFPWRWKRRVELEPVPSGEPRRRDTGPSATSELIVPGEPVDAAAAWFARKAREAKLAETRELS